METLTPLDAISLPVLHETIRACRKCESAGYLAEARPITGGSAEAKIFLIGQAPSRTDHETREFYNGPAGRKLRQWFEQAGYAPTDFGRLIYPAAITKCFPGRLPGSSKDRLPSRTEQALCRPWLDAELARIQPAVLVLFGGLAIKTFLGNGSLSELVGKTFAKDGRRIIPLPHSSGASTWLNQEENRELLKQAIIELQIAREFIVAGQGNDASR